jgi:hypothetical protein
MIPPIAFCAQSDKKHIADLLTTLDESNWLTIGIRTPCLIQIGNRIGHVHPVSFIQAAIDDPILRQRVRRVFASSIKRMGFLYGNGFAEGFSHRLNREYKRKNLEPHAEWLARSLGIRSEKIRPLMRARDWNGLFVHLCEETDKCSVRTFRS